MKKAKMTPKMIFKLLLSIEASEEPEENQLLSVINKR